MLTKTSKKIQLSEEFLESFSVIPDKRINRNKRHSLKNILIIAICGILCGADSWLAIEKIGKCKLKWFRKFLWLPHGIPSHDTFARIFVWLDPKGLQDFLAKWANEFHELVEGETIAIDGKTQKRSFDCASKKSAIHMVTAFACESGLALGLTKVASKSNEIKAIPEVLDIVDVKNCTVTIDAIGCQKSIATKIRERGADYVLAVKKNQLNLYLQIKMLLDGFRHMDQLPEIVKFHSVESVGHGRHELRRYWITDYIKPIKGREDWKDFNSIGCVESTRTIKGKTTIETRYFIASIDASAPLFAKNVKSHWKIENSYHWRLDVIFRADDNRMRLGHSPENFSVLQAFSLNLLKREESSQNSVRIKRHMCANDENYLQKVFFIWSKNFSA
jgi:predicted transposase YbfD/YdcC